MAKSVAACRRHESGAQFRTGRPLRLELLESRTLLAVLSVGPEGSFSSIQTAVDHARTGDVVLIAEGLYAESVNLSRMGSAVGGGTGDLTLRGASAADTIIRPLAGPALFNSAPFAGDVLLEQLGFRAPGAAPPSSGLVLTAYSGHFELVDSVFQEIAANGLEVQQSQGELAIRSSEFHGIGSGTEHSAILIRDWSGPGVIADCTIRDAAANGVLWENTGQRQASLMIRDNQIHGGDGSVTRTGIRARLAGSTDSDLSLDNNKLDRISGEALDVIARESAVLQTRWTRNELANTQGAVSNRLLLEDQARGSAMLQDNAILDTAGDGLVLELHGAAELVADLHNNLFLSIGGVLDSRGLLLSSSADATGSLRARLSLNSFVSVADSGLLITAGGASEMAVQVQGSFFGDVGGAGDYALRAEQPAGSSAELQLKLFENNVRDSAGGAYGLQQRGATPILLEGTAAFPEAELATTNLGGPISVLGDVRVVAPPALAPLLPQLIEGFVWKDLDGDGRQGPQEPGLADVILELSGLQQGGTDVHLQTQSDGGGRYAFAGLSAGDYQVSIAVPGGYRLTLPRQGDDPGMDSDFDDSTRLATIALPATGDRWQLDAGLLPTWQNPRDHRDVNADGLVTPLDALLLINDINANGIRTLPIPPQPPSVPPPYLDVDGNGGIAPADVLQVVNFLNGIEVGGAAGEGEAGQSAPFALGTAVGGSPRDGGLGFGQPVAEGALLVDPFHQQPQRGDSGRGPREERPAENRCTTARCCWRNRTWESRGLRYSGPRGCGECR